MSDAADLSDVDTSRIASSSSDGAMHTLVQSGEDRLVLRPAWLIRAIAAALIGLAALIVSAWARSNDNDKPALLFVGGFFMIIGVGAWLAPQRVVFDRTRDMLRKRSWLFFYRYRLSDVAAVQIIDGGTHHVRSKRHYRTYHTRELNLVLHGPANRRINLTNHSDNATTRAMAGEIARFLHVPLLDRFAHEAAGDAARRAAEAQAAGPPLVKWLRRAARVAYLAAFVLGFFSVILYFQQAKLDELEASMATVRARLVSSDVREWNAGENDWSAFGKFEVETPPFAGPATGELIPDSYYRDHDINRTSGGAKIARATADEFAAKWEVGKSYEAFLYPEAKDRLFFEQLGAAKNAENTRWLRNAALLSLAAGLALSTAATFVSRRTRV
jgi:hypothetical protein